MPPAWQWETRPAAGWVMWSMSLALSGPHHLPYKVARLDQALTLCDSEAPEQGWRLGWAEPSTLAKKGHGTLVPTQPTKGLRMRTSWPPGNFFVSRNRA